MKNFKQWLTIAIASAAPAAISAANYYASPKGNGNGTSYSTPCSLTSGISKLSSPGDTLFVLGGQYDITSKVTVNKSGNSSKNIVITSYPGETPILDFRSQPYGSEVTGSNNVGISISTSAKYLHVKGLTIRYAGKNGLINYGSYCTIENLDVYGCGDTGIQHKTGGGNKIINCDSHDNFDYKTLASDGTADYGGNADGFADKQYTNQEGNTYIGCRSWNNSDDGWDFYQRIGNSVFHDCICYKNGPEDFDMSSHPRLAIDKAWFDQFPKSVTDRHGNTVTVTLENYVNLGNGNGFKLGGDKTTHDVKLYNCLSAENTVRGFDQNNNYGTMEIYNCSAYSDGINYGFGNKSGGTLILKNNVSLAGKSSNSFVCPTVTSGYNSWNTSGVTCTSKDFLSTDATLILTPRNADGSLANTLFMKLAEGSNLIDKGTDIGLPYSGTAPDLGCYEFGELNPMPGIVTCESANSTQVISIGNAIRPMIFKWSGTATSLTIQNLPTGLNNTVNTAEQTLTVSGSPTATGIQTFSVSTNSEYGNNSIECTIDVRYGNFKNIAYVTTPDNSADFAILSRLTNNDDFAVTILPAATINDYSAYDMILISAVPNSSAAGLPSIESLNKPKVLLKPFLLKNTVWNWGNAVNSSDTDIAINELNHPIFKNIQTDNGYIKLFSSVATNGVTAVSEWYNASQTIKLASPASSSLHAVTEIPVGSTINGTQIASPFIMIGVSEYSTANLTDAGLKLIENGCYYVLNMSIDTSIGKDITENSELKIIRNGNTICTDRQDMIKQISVISLSGNNMLSNYGNEINIAPLNKGIYILRILSHDGSIANIKFVR